MTTLKGVTGQRYGWLRQVSDTAEGSIAGILSTITTYLKGDGLALKCADGTTWQGAIDSETPVNSLADLTALQAQCAAAGVSFLPVVVPRGVDPTGEGQFHAQIAATCGALMVDLEPYAGFYDGSALTTIPTYCAALRAGAPGASLVLEPDPRAYAWQAIDVPGIAQYFDAFAPQDYVGWTAAQWTDVAAEVATFGQFAALGKPLLPTLWGVDQIQLAGQFWGEVIVQCSGMVLFALGSMNAAELEYFAGLPLPAPAPSPAPGPDVPDALTRAKELVASLTADLANAQGLVADLST